MGSQSFNGLKSVMCLVWEPQSLIKYFYIFKQEMAFSAKDIHICSA